MTEALAELWHRRIREEWGFADEDGPSLAGLFRQQYRGSRYSWGYPACPDLEDQVKLDELLTLDKIGVKLTEEFQLEPEQSTSAIIVPHPEAKYFIAFWSRSSRSTRVGRLWSLAAPRSRPLDLELAQGSARRGRRRRCRTR